MNLQSVRKRNCDPVQILGAGWWRLCVRGLRAEQQKETSYLSGSELYGRFARRALGFGLEACHES